MWDYVFSLGRQVTRATGHLDMNQWIVVFVVALVIGALFLRGFGSRTGY